MKKVIKLIGALLFVLIPIMLCLGYLLLGAKICILGFCIYLSTCVYLLCNVSHQLTIVSRLRGLVYSFFFLENHPKHLMIWNNVKMMHPQKISFGNNCTVLDGAVFAPLVSHSGNTYPSRIIIGNNVHIGANDRIASMNSVIIEDDVLFAAFVHITDHSHEFHQIGKPISQQSVYSKGPVVIKRGAWLAFGCHILSGVTIGEGSVVAANSVVTKDVPAYSVVAGNPARIVSKFNFETQTWDRI